MSIYALISLLCFMVCIFLGAFIYFRSPKSLINRLFLGLSLSMANSAFIQFGYRQAQTFEQALFWWEIDFLWPLSTALALAFILVFVERKGDLKTAKFWAPVGGPALIFISLEACGHYLTSEPHKKYWGWTYSVPENGISQIAYLWLAGVLLTCLILVARFYSRVDNLQKKKQARMIAVGLIIALLAQIVDVVLNWLQVESPPFFTISTVFINSAIGFAIWKYRLFSLTPVTAAQTILSTMSDSLLLVSPERRILSSNAAAQELLGLNEHEINNLRVEEIFPQESDRPAWLTDAATKKGEATGRVKYLETSFKTRKSGVVPVSLSGSTLRDLRGNIQGFVLIGRDISERKQAEEELKNHRDHLEELVERRTKELKQETFEKMIAERAKADLEEQLHQAQKMEAIGRLAGGVAHDFNNLLFVITGYSEAYLLSAPESDPFREDIEQIHKAARRAAALTQQLLAFSRKQVIKPKLIDLKETFNSIRSMLGRIIGEDIDLIFNHLPNLGQIWMDPVQLDQVIANLFVNARDAMPSGGTLTVTAKNVSFDKKMCEMKPEAEPGIYVVLSVHDTGYGMDENTKRKIFEPFFTTKGRGKGTGLGLSTVYGIVKQNKGFIEVTSKPGEGSTFDIYVPIAKGEAVVENQVAELVVPKGTETILLVEDEVIVRRLASQLLKKQGYRVLEAKDAREAMALFQENEGNIDLLFTDIVMPGMSGRQLSEHLLGTKPNLRVLYMSGHNEEIIDKYGCLNADEPLLQKPFSSADLSWKIREVLDA